MPKGRARGRGRGASGVGRGQDAGGRVTRGTPIIMTINAGSLLGNTTPFNISSLMNGHMQPGMILSPAADPIPRTLVQRIQVGQFVEMRDLLADNIELLNQLSSLHGTVTLPLTIVNCTRLREVSSLESWVYCFNAYVAVCTSDPATRDMLAYSRLFIREALRHGQASHWRLHWTEKKRKASTLVAHSAPT